MDPILTGLASVVQGGPAVWILLMAALRLLRAVWVLVGLWRQPGQIQSERAYAALLEGVGITLIAGLVLPWLALTLYPLAGQMLLLIAGAAWLGFGLFMRQACALARPGLPDWAPAWFRSLLARAGSEASLIPHQPNEAGNLPVARNGEAEFPASSSPVLPN